MKATRWKGVLLRRSGWCEGIVSAKREVPYGIVAVLRMEDAFVVFVIGEFQDINATTTLRPLSSRRASRTTGLSPDQQGGRVKGCHEVQE